jgi:hypothetical protein
MLMLAGFGKHARFLAKLLEAPESAIDRFVLPNPHL